MQDVMDETAVLARTRAFVEESFLYMRPRFVLGDDDRLFEKGVIDSMGVLELIGFLEPAFGVTVTDEEINEHNLGSLADIARYVASRHRNDAAA